MLSTTQRWIAAGGLALIAGGLLGSVLTYRAATGLAAPALAAVGPPPPRLDAKPVEIRSESGAALRGWLLGGEPGVGGVVLMHGVRSNRRSMISRAEFLNRNGFTVLLFDFQAHGESRGQRITFGHLEALDAKAAVGFLRASIPGEPVSALGTSLGGAAALLGAEPLEVDALILEAVYSDVRRAVRNRLKIRFGPMGAWLAPLLTVQLRPRIGVSIDSLRPIDGIRRVQCPVLVIAGTVDQRTTLDEAREMFAAAPQPKEFWAVQGARHVDLHGFAGAEYEQAVLGFLAKHTAATGSQAL